MADCKVQIGPFVNRYIAVKWSELCAQLHHNDFTQFDSVYTIHLQAKSVHAHLSQLDRGQRRWQKSIELTDSLKKMKKVSNNNINSI